MYHFLFMNCFVRSKYEKNIRQSFQTMNSEIAIVVLSLKLKYFISPANVYGSLHILNIWNKTTSFAVHEERGRTWPFGNLLTGLKIIHQCDCAAKPVRKHTAQCPAI